MIRIELHDCRGGWLWKAVSTNGSLMAVNHPEFVGYRSRASAVRAIRTLFPDRALFPIVDGEGPFLWDDEVTGSGGGLFAPMDPEREAEINNQILSVVVRGGE